LISVIVATHNRSSLLAETLAALAAQEIAREPFEIVVVDNASTDDTLRVATLFGSRPGVPPIRVLQEPRPGKSHAMNKAVAEARGRILACTDDDVLPDPWWLAAIVAAMDETRADFAVGRIRPRWETTPPRWVSARLSGVLAIPDNGPERFEIRSGVNEHAMPIGANMALRSDVVSTIGGWRADLGKLQHTLRSGEDHEFFLRMLGAGMRGVYEPRASVAHFVPADRLRRAYFLRWLHDNGRIVAAIDREYPGTSHYLLGIPRYRWRGAGTECLRLAASLVPGKGADRFANFTRVLWYIGYLRGALSAGSVAGSDDVASAPGGSGAGAWQGQ